MATAIHSIVEHVPTPEEQKTAAMADVETAIADNAEAIAEVLKTINLLREKGVLDIANAFLDQSSDIFKIIVDQAAKPEYAGGIKNAIAMMQLFSSLDFGVINHLAGSLSQTSKAIDEGTVPMAGGVFKMLRYLRDPDVSAGLGLMLMLLKGIGQSVRQASCANNNRSSGLKDAP